uniref:Alternative protein LZTFL1 n=1 Tax=Homo sapiens TaxID=9606 RepID=L8EB17_HUMAN|nr:alternative protein LZTFL1 [Homo sapiens]
MDERRERIKCNNEPAFTMYFLLTCLSIFRSLTSFCALLELLLRASFSPCISLALN